MKKFFVFLLVALATNVGANNPPTIVFFKAVPDTARVGQIVDFWQAVTDPDSNDQDGMGAGISFGDKPFTQASIPTI